MGHELFVIAREERPGYPEYKMIKDELDGIPVLRIVNNFKRLQESYYYDYHPRIEEIFEGKLLRLKPDLVHIQHLAGASWGIPGIVKKHGFPLVVSLHDYWYACERVQLLRPDGTICPGPEGGRNCALYCAHGALSFMASAVMERFKFALGLIGRLPAEKAALKTAAVLQRLIMHRWTRKLERIYGSRCARLLEALTKADILISPSEKARSIYSALGVPSGRHIVIPHGMPEFRVKGDESSRRDYDGERHLKIGYVGNIMGHKGVETLLKAVRRFPRSKVQLNMYGRSYPPRYASFIKKATSRFPSGQVGIHGVYQPDALPGILASLDLLVIPSLWHETFNLVLWEAWAARLPVIVSRVGAMVDFVRDGVDGLTFSPGNWRDLRKKISNILDEPTLLDKLHQNLPRTCLSLDENAKRYEDVYMGLVASYSKKSDMDN